jgi:hypothetical protein
MKKKKGVLAFHEEVKLPSPFLLQTIYFRPYQPNNAEDCGNLSVTQNTNF